MITVNSNFVIKYFNSVMKVCFSQLFVKSVKHDPKGRQPHAFDAGGKILWASGRPKSIIIAFPYMCSDGENLKRKKDKRANLHLDNELLSSKRGFFYLIFGFFSFSWVKELSQ